MRIEIDNLTHREAKVERWRPLRKKAYAEAVVDAELPDMDPSPIPQQANLAQIRAARRALQ